MLKNISARGWDNFIVIHMDIIKHNLTTTKIKKRKLNEKVEKINKN